MTEQKENQEYVVKAVEDAYIHASGSWTEADWTHERRPVCDEPICEIEMDANGDVVYCEGGDAKCQTCIDAEASASGAEKSAKQAMDAWRARNFPKAIKLMREAVGYEDEYGASPVWGPVLKAMRLAYDDEE